jgi:hypothetical protein
VKISVKTFCHINFQVVGWLAGLCLLAINYLIFCK